jgi:hypothetical protein
MARGMEALDALRFPKPSSMSVQRAYWSVIVSVMSVPGTKRTNTMLALNVSY